MTERNHLGPETGETTNRAPARITLRAVSGSSTVPAPINTFARQGLRELLDQPHRSRHGHRHLERRDATLGERQGDLAADAHRR